MSFKPNTNPSHTCYLALEILTASRYLSFQLSEVPPCLQVGFWACPRCLSLDTLSSSEPISGPVRVCRPHTYPDSVRLAGSGRAQLLMHALPNITADFLRDRPSRTAEGEMVPASLLIQESTGPERGQIQGTATGLSLCPPLPQQLQTTKVCL